MIHLAAVSINKSIADPDESIDINMVGMNGAEVLRRMKSGPRGEVICVDGPCFATQRGVFR